MRVFDELQLIRDEEAGRLPYRKPLIGINALVSRTRELKRIREADARYMAEMDEALMGGLERDIQELGLGKERRG